MAFRRNDGRVILKSHHSALNSTQEIVLLNLQIFQKMNTRKDQLQAFDRLLTIMDELREQCPWDRKQTMETLRHLTIEETYELGDAILEDDMEEVKKELGDLMLHMNCRPIQRLRAS